MFPKLPKIPLLLAVVIACSSCQVFRNIDETSTISEDESTAVTSAQANSSLVSSDLKRHIDNSNRKISENLLLAMVQIEGLNPYETLVEIEKEHPNEFAVEVNRSLSNAGYAVRFTNNPRPKNHFKVKVSVNEQSLGALDTPRTTTYTIELNGIQVSRQYRYDQDDTIIPVGPIKIHGAPYQPIVTNDEVFGLNQITDVRFVGGEDVAKSDKQTQTDDINPEKNMFVTMESTYQSIFDKYYVRDSTIIKFADDSLVLGNTGKEQLAVLVEGMDPSRDIISVVGCSLGPTEIKNGNEVLAKGRAKRVKEELMYAGISSKVIHDEGCWAPSTMEEVLPSSAVIVEVKRPS